MSFLHIKTHGLNDVDTALLKSIVQLANNSLTQKWQLVESGTIDLHLYSLESNNGKNSWQQHNKKNIAVILLADSQSYDGAELILRKPLQIKNVSALLSTIEKNILQKGKNITEKAIKIEKESFFSKISNYFKAKKSSHHENLPTLSFHIPEMPSNQNQTITDPKLLSQWLEQLSENDSDKIISAILSNLILLNHSDISSTKRLTLLDIYRRPIRQLIFHRNLNSIQSEQSSPAAFSKSINNLSLLFDEFIIAYKIIVNELYQSGAEPSSNSYYLITIGRLAELTSLAILHSYRHYRSAPSGAMQDLHQLFLYCEASNTLDKTVEIKGVTLDKPFSHFYHQIILTAISDPFSLEKYDVFRLFHLMENMADKIEITALSKDNIKASNTLLLASNFYFSCISDCPPLALSLISHEDRAHPQARLISTYPLLPLINDMITTKKGGILDMQLLQKIIPQFKASYHRKYSRIPTAGYHSVNIANGINAIHKALNNSDYSSLPQWQLCNKSDDGVMAKINSGLHLQLNIGDFIGIFSADSPPMLFILRWLHYYNDKVIIGLEISTKSPQAVTLTPNDGAADIKCLLTIDDKESTEEKMLISSKGVFSERRIFEISENKETYLITSHKLINHSLYFEQFSFKVKARS